MESVNAVNSNYRYRRAQELFSRSDVRARFSLLLFGSQQVGRVYVQQRSQARQRLEREVLFAAFDATHVIGLAPERLGDFRLGQTLGATKPSNIASDADDKWRGRRSAHGVDQTPVGRTRATHL